MEHGDQFRHLGHLDLAGDRDADESSDRKHRQNQRQRDLWRQAGLVNSGYAAFAGQPRLVYRLDDGGGQGQHHADHPRDIAHPGSGLFRQSGQRQNEQHACNDVQATNEVEQHAHASFLNMPSIR